LLYDSPLGRLEAYRDILFILVPLSIVAVCLFVDELLAPRALGGLLVLVPALILDAARWHESGWRYIMVVLAYMLVVKGCILIVAPYKFRKGAEALFLNPARARWGGATGVALGLTLAILGFAVY